mmetsp:Transcript_41130/g.129191  ORF Transcript_41130/g.129191 Transcript_41130/m.129191 type:complete len:105 (-) Transcript_41130:548-862(-)
MAGDHAWSHGSNLCVRRWERWGGEGSGSMVRPFSAVCWLILVSRHRWFGQNMGFKDSQCMIMAHRKSQDVKPSRSAIPKSLAQVHVVSTTLEESHDLIKEEFDR